MLSSYNRDTIFNQYEERTFDLLVIGGGITGSGIALDAATRGLSVGLVEMQDFASGTSSRSTKLIHGGLRYLKNLEIKMVADVGKEREIVYENGPHVTTPEWMILPFYQGGTFGPLMSNIGLLIYDFLARVKRSERRKMLSKEEVLKKVPLLKRDGLKGAGFYVEYKTDDARLTIDVLKKAVEKGARAINYAKVIKLKYNDTGKIIGAIIQDQITGKKLTVHAKKIINATGPWVDTLRDLDNSKHEKTLLLSKGVHIVFSQELFPLEQAIYFDAPDGRMIFAIPRDDKVYVGTTDTKYEGSIAHPTVTQEDKEYLLDIINYIFPKINLNMEDVESSWAGLRPLIAEEGKSLGEISRKDEIIISNSNLISIAGGKLTGYRKMAEDVVDLVVSQLHQEEGIIYSDCTTRNLPISGGEVGGSKGFIKFKQESLEKAKLLGINRSAAEKLIHRYGSNINTIFNIYQEKQNKFDVDDKELIVLAELVYALEFELAYKPIDFFIRRTGALLFDIHWVKEHKDLVINYMAKKLNWTSEEKNIYYKELLTMLEEA